MVNFPRKKLIMDKKLSQKYLKLKHEISKYIFKINECLQIIDDFNSYLLQLSKECSDNTYNKTAIEYYHSKANELEKQLLVSKNIDTSTKKIIEDLKNELKTIEQKFGNLIRQTNINSTNISPDYDIICRAEKRINEIKRELKKYQVYETEAIESSLSSFRSIELDYKSLVNLFNSHKPIYESNLNSKYINVLGAFEILELLKTDYQHLTNKLNSLPHARDRLKIIEIPQPKCQPINQELLNKVVNYLDAYSVFKAKNLNHSGTVSYLITKMINNHYTSHIMPKLTSEVKEFPLVIAINFAGEASFKCSHNKNVKICGPVCKNYDDAIINIVKNFDSKGYAVLEVKKGNSLSKQLIAVDIVGNIYNITDANSPVNVIPQVLAILDILYNRKSIDMLEPSYLEDSTFIECLNYFLERKYLYEIEVLDEDRKYLSKNDKHFLSSLKSSGKSNSNKTTSSELNNNVF